MVWFDFILKVFLSDHALFYSNLMLFKRTSEMQFISIVCFFFGTAIEKDYIHACMCDVLRCVIQDTRLRDQFSKFIYVFILHLFYAFRATIT